MSLWASTNKGKSIFVKVHSSFYITVPSSHILSVTTLQQRNGATMYKHSREGKHRYVEDWLVFKWAEMVSVMLCLIYTVKAYLVLVYALHSKEGIIMSLGIITVGSAGTVVKKPRLWWSELSSGTITPCIHISFFENTWWCLPLISEDKVLTFENVIEALKC